MTAKPRRHPGPASRNNLAWIWIIIALALIGAAWAYSSRLRSHRQDNTLPQSVAALNNAPAQALFNTTIPASLPAQIKEYEGFTVNFNADNHTPNYVAWELLDTELNGTISRTDNFWCDPEIKGCPDLPDYKRSGFDRGHLYPAADAKWSTKSMSDCFSLANMAPQTHSLNSGAWKTLEDKERLWARRDKRLIIIAGPVYTPADTYTIGMTKVRVPSAFFKVILAPDLPTPRSIAFVYPNDYSPGNMQNYSMTVDECEALTGFDFFASLPDSIQQAIESITSFKEWNQR